MKIKFLILFALISIGSLSQSQVDLRVNIGQSGLDKIAIDANTSEIDSVTNVFAHRLMNGQLSYMNERQKTLGYFSRLFYHNRSLEHSLYLVDFDSLYPSLKSTFQELGFYKIVWILEDINQYRNDNPALFQGNKVSTILDYTDEAYDYGIGDLRDELCLLIEDMHYNREHLEVIRNYILLHSDQLVR